jgi:hypothetical protein
MKRRLILLTLAMGVCPHLTGVAAAQESANFKLREHVINAGGHPDAGTLVSPAFRMRLDALGEGLTAAGLFSATWRMDAGFTSGYTPPGEVTNLRFSDASTLVWNPERSIGTYALYRGILRDFLPAYGFCRQSDLLEETAVDLDRPVVGAGFYYHVTGRNRLREEGTKGFNSAGIERPNPGPCP